MTSILKKIQEIWSDIRQNSVISIFAITVGVTLTAALLLFLVESPTNKGFESLGNSIWWAFVTITTTGYGDITPSEPLGKIFAVLLMFSGTIVLSLLSGTVSSLLVTRKLREGQGLEDVKLKNHVIICGWNPNLEIIVANLAEYSAQIGGLVLVNQLSGDKISALLSQFKKIDIKFVRGSSSDEDVLNRANVKAAKSAIIIPDESFSALANLDERTLLTTLALKSMNSKIKVFAHIVDRANRSTLQRAKADAVIVGGVHASFLLANHVVSSGVSDALEDLMDASSGARFKQVQIPNELVGKKFIDAFLYFRTAKQSILVGIVSEERSLSISDVLSDGSDSYLDEFIRRKFEESGKKINRKAHQVKLNPSDDYEIQSTDSGLLIQND